MNICVFGDSITWGACDYKQGGWVTRLRNYFEERGDTPMGADGRLVDVALYNLGVAGDTSDDLLKRFLAEAEAREPDVVVFSIGTNDSQYFKSRDNPRVPLERFKRNMSKLYELALSHTMKIVFIGLLLVDESKTTPVSWAQDKYYDNQGLGLYNDALKALTQEKGILFVDTSKILTSDDLEDGLHPNSEGHAKMFEYVRSALIGSL